MVRRLEESEIATALNDLNEMASGTLWIVEEGKLSKSFKFKSFIRAFGWMTQIAIWAEKLKHHPEWFNVYNTVEVKLVTHDVDGISELDFELAKKMETFK